MLTYTTIAAGTDGSETATLAVRKAASLARVYDATLVLVCAYYKASGSVLNAPGSETSTVPVVSEEYADACLKEAEAIAREEGATNVRLHKVAGAPVNAITEAVQETGADLLVMGNRGMRSLAGRLFGNVPTGVTRRSTVDVMIVNTEAH